MATINIKSTADVHTNGIKCVLYGASGIGKTRMAAGAPNPIFISAEKGLLSLADQDIPYIEIKNYKEFREAVIWCAKSDYETIVLDSLSEIATVSLLEFKSELIAASSKGKIDGRQPYGVLAEKIGTVIRGARDLDGKNVIFIAKEKKETDELSSAVTFEAYLPGQVLPFDLPYLVDEVFCLQIDQKGRQYVQTAIDIKRICKDRSGRLNNPEKPDFNVIFNKIKGE